VFTRSGITPPKVSRFGWNLECSEHIVGGWSWQILDAIRTIARTGEPGEILFLLGKQRTILPISRRPNFRKFEHNTSIGVAMNPFETVLKIYPQGVVFRENLKTLKFLNVLWLQAATTRQWLQIDGNPLPNDPPMGFLVSILPLESIQSHFLACTLRTRNLSPNFLRRWMRIDGTARHIRVILVTHSITQAVMNWRSTIESRDDRPWILGRVECTK